MSKINILSEQLTNMIAAGEVVERPLQVVKELVENSIDANSRNINIELKCGGIEYIRVSDDGIGMDNVDIKLAFERHATSKLKNENELFSISTMGFRGEAIPSIASVSITTCISCDSKDSNKIIVDNGKLISCVNFQANKGTTFIVEKLFAKVPARLKYLKNDYYEQALIVNLIHKLALIHNDIAFSLVADGNTLFESDGKNNLVNTIYKIYGANVANNLLPFKSNDYDMQIDGVIVPPSLARSNKNQITISLNSRLIKPSFLTSIILKACKQYFEKGKFPILLLNITMDAQLTDINVSPSKLEVKISKANQLENCIYNCINDTLKKNVSYISFSDQQLDNISNTYNNYLPKQENIEKFSYEIPTINDNAVFEDSFVYKDNNIDSSYLINDTKQENKVEVTLRAQESQFSSTLANTTNIRLIGQCHGKYILAEDDQGLLIIDQHAAQERVHYEQLREKMCSQFNQHLLLTPILLNVSNDVVKNIDFINKKSEALHIHFDAFGDDCLVIRSLPAWSKDILDEGFYKDLINDLLVDKNIEIEDAIHKKIATRACKSSIKFNQFLDTNQMQQVINELFACCDPYACPHGRPIIIHLSDAQLEKEFAR